MAKKIKSKPKRPPVEWSSAQETSLLAWLEYTLKHDELDFKKTAVKHLNDIFDLEQIDRKLWRLWNEYGPDLPVGTSHRQWKKEQNIYDHGSACLVGLSEDDKREIASTTQLLEDEFIANQMAVSSQRQLRSASKSDRSSLIRDYGSRPQSTSREEPQGLSSQLTTPSSSPLPLNSRAKRISPLSSKSISRPKRQKLLLNNTVSMPRNIYFAG